MKPLIPLVLVGCGGHASDVLSVIEACNMAGATYEVVGYLDDDAEADGRRLRSRGVTRIGGTHDIARLDAFYCLGIGYPEHRARVAAGLKGRGKAAQAVVHPNASLAAGVVLEHGVVVFGGAQCGPLARVAEGAMLARAAIVGHDSLISEYVSVMPGAVVSGDCSIGVGALIGSNATVLEGLQVGEWSRLGAGAVLTESLAAGCTAMGVPARVVNSCR